MANTIYQNNEVEITVEKVDKREGKINFNGKNLMWISLPKLEEFKQKLTELLDHYRI